MGPTQASTTAPSGAKSDWHTHSLGAGHIFGVGALSDTEFGPVFVQGNDQYHAVRNSQGFGLVGGLGVLHDAKGDDLYDFYIPAPLDPTAPNQTEGAGGVRDDEGQGLCDRIPRFVQGAAQVGTPTLGVLVDENGSDTYHGVFVDSFTSPTTPVTSARAGSLGFGANLATGVFIDVGGDADTYIVDNEPSPHRGNNTVLAPGTDSTGTGGGQGFFTDR